MVPRVQSRRPGHDDERGEVYRYSQISNAAAKNHQQVKTHTSSSSPNCPAMSRVTHHDSGDSGEHELVLLLSRRRGLVAHLWTSKGRQRASGERTNETECAMSAVWLTLTFVIFTHMLRLPRLLPALRSSLKGALDVQYMHAASDYAHPP